MQNDTAGVLQYAHSTCEKHSELLDLAHSTNSLAIKTNEIVAKIDQKLMGNYDTPGLLSEINDLKIFKKSFDETKALEKVKSMDKNFRLMTRIVYWMCGLVGTGFFAWVTGLLDKIQKG